MITAELRGGNRPSLNEALGWIGSKVDDIYGASVGRLEDVWIDPGTGAPKWLLVKEGRFGGRTTLIPFEDATAGAGHVWIPYERDVVREAPAVAPGAPLTQSVESTLRSHYTANKPASPAHRGRGQAPAAAPAAAPPPPTPQPPAYREQAPQYQIADDQQSQYQHDPHQPLPPLPPSPPPVPPARPSRSGHEGQATPARPQYVPQAQHQYRPPQALPGHSAAQAAPPTRYAPPAPRTPHPGPPPGRAARQVPQPPPAYTPAPYGQGQPPHYAYGPPQPRSPAQGLPPQSPRQVAPATTPPSPAPIPPGAHAADDPPVAIPIIHALDQPYRIEVQLEGELRISGELKGFSIKPSRPAPAGPESGP